MEHTTPTPPEKPCSACGGTGTKAMAFAAREAWAALHVKGARTFTIPQLSKWTKRPAATTRTAIKELANLGHVVKRDGERGHNDADLWSLSDPLARDHARAAQS